MTGALTGTLRSGGSGDRPGSPLTLTTGDGVTVHRAGHLDVALVGGVPAGSGSAPLDGAALLAATWPRAGERCLASLSGEWLAVLWDRHTNRLTCVRSARSRVRLFWRTDRGVLEFATALADLFPAAGPARILDEDFLGELLANRVTTYDRSPFSGVRRLPAGHLLEVGAAGTVRVRRWYEPAVAPLALDRDAAAEELRGRLDTVVADYVAPAGTGVLVSGGIDSTAVLGLARRVAPPGSVAGCALVFPGQPHDESAWLDIVDRYAGDPVYRLVARDYDWPKWTAWSAASLLPPVRPNAATMDAAVALFAASGVPRILTGEGGDNWFGGGPLHWAGQVAKGRLGSVWRAARHGYPSPRSTARMLWHAGAAPLLTAPRRNVVPAWIGPGFAARTGLAERLRAAEVAEHRSARDPVAARLARSHQPQSAWAAEGLRERCAGHGVDWLHPLHDQRVADLVLRLPGEVMWRAGESKSLLRAAVADVVPDAIARRQSKAAFGAPIAAAIRAIDGVRSLAGHPLVTEGYLHLPALRELENRALAHHDAGLRVRHRGESLGALWAVLAAAAWFTAVAPS